MDAAFLEDLKEFVGFDAHDERLVREIAPLMASRLDGLADRFYEALARHPGTREFVRGEERIRNLKKSFKEWARGLFESDRGATYLQKRARIGRMHVQIGLPQRYMFTAMNIVRGYLVECVTTHAGNDLEWAYRLCHAMNRILDIELAIMLETYQEDLLEKLRRNERLATLGLIAATVNHELRNPLGVAKTSLDAIRRRTDAVETVRRDERVQRHLKKIHSSLGRMERTVSSLLNYARYQEPELRTVEVGGILRAVLEENPSPPGVAVELGGEALGAEWVVDPTQVRQVFANLILNAYQAMSAHGGRLDITAGRLEEGIRVLLEDTGPGIPPVHREAVFEPLWSGRRDGVGLGLAICRNIVQAHRGRIYLREPVSGSGAAFCVDIPIPGGKV